MLDGRYSCVMGQELHGSPIRRYGELTLRSRDGRLSGSMFPPMFWLDAPFSGGTAKGEQFAFTVYFATPCQQFSMEVEGRVEGDTLTGTVRSPMGEHRLEGTRIR